MSVGCAGCPVQPNRLYYGACANRFITRLTEPVSAYGNNPTGHLSPRPEQRGHPPTNSRIYEAINMHKVFFALKMLNNILLFITRESLKPSSFIFKFTTFTFLSSTFTSSN
ncbi:hypothetical protein BsWGS_01088 [Bradybaena similaris]